MEFVWEFKETVFCQGGRKSSCPPTKESVERCSVYAREEFQTIKVAKFLHAIRCIPLDVEHIQIKNTRNSISL